MNNDYMVYYVNHNYYAQPCFSTLNCAIKYGRGKGMEFAVYHKSRRVANWSVFGGLRLL